MRLALMGVMLMVGIGLLFWWATIKPDGQQGYRPIAPSDFNAAYRNKVHEVVDTLYIDETVKIPLTLYESCRYSDSRDVEFKQEIKRRADSIRGDSGSFEGVSGYYDP